MCFKKISKKISRVFLECFNEVLLCNFVFAWISSQLPEQKEGFFIVVRDVGEMETLPYRLLLGGGGYIWLTTVAWLEKHQKMKNSCEHIHCIHTVVS